MWPQTVSWNKGVCVCGVLGFYMASQSREKRGGCVAATCSGGEQTLLLGGCSTLAPWEEPAGRKPRFRACTGSDCTCLLPADVKPDFRSAEDDSYPKVRPPITCLSFSLRPFNHPPLPSPLQVFQKNGAGWVKGPVNLCSMKRICEPSCWHLF